MCDLFWGKWQETISAYFARGVGGIRSRSSQHPVTFDRQTGERVSLEDILNMTVQEADARLTGSAYKYMKESAFTMKNMP